MCSVASHPLSGLACALFLPSPISVSTDFPGRSNGPSGAPRPNENNDPPPHPKQANFSALFPNSPYRTSPNSAAELRATPTWREFKIAAPRRFRSRYGRAGGSVRRRSPVDQFKSVVRARRSGVCQVFRSVIWRFRNRRLYDRGSLSDPSSPRSALLSTWNGNRVVQGHLRHGADLLDPSRCGWDAVQLFGSNRKLDRGGNFECLLCGQPKRLATLCLTLVRSSESTWPPMS